MERRRICVISLVDDAVVYGMPLWSTAELAIYRREEVATNVRVCVHAVSSNYATESKDNKDL